MSAFVRVTYKLSKEKQNQQSWQKWNVRTKATPTPTNKIRKKLRIWFFSQVAVKRILERRRQLWGIDNQDEEPGLRSKPWWRSRRVKLLVIGWFLQKTQIKCMGFQGKGYLCLAVQSLVLSSCCTAKINSLPPCNIGGDNIRWCLSWATTRTILKYLPWEFIKRNHTWSSAISFTVSVWAATCKGRILQLGTELKFLFDDLLICSLKVKLLSILTSASLPWNSRKRWGVSG